MASGLLQQDSQALKVFTGQVHDLFLDFLRHANQGAGLRQIGCYGVILRMLVVHLFVKLPYLIQQLVRAEPGLFQFFQTVCPETDALKEQGNEDLVLILK